MSQKDYSIRVSKETVFSNQDTHDLLQLVIKRWNYDLVAAHVAWCRFLQCNPSYESFKKMCINLGVKL